MKADEERMKRLKRWTEKKNAQPHDNGQGDGDAAVAAAVERYRDDPRYR